MTSARMPGGSDPDAPGIRRSGDAVRRFVELSTFCGFAIAQPILDSFGRAPEHFVFRGASTTGIILFAIVVVLGPPLLLTAVTAAAAWASDRIGRAVHIALLAVLGGLAGVQVGWRAFDLTSIPLLAFAIVIGGAVASLYLRVPPFRLWARYAVVLPVAAVVSFLFLSSTSDLVWSRTVDATALDLAETPPIVVLVLDELPTATLMSADGTIDAGLFPNFARLGEIGTWYRNNSTNSNNTTLAVPALLTGRIPDQLEATLANHPQNLFTLLGGSYDIRADEAPIRLCPENLCGSVSTSGGGLGKLLGDARRLWRAQISIGDPGDTVFDLIEETVAVEPSEDADSLSAEAIAAAFQERERLMTTSPARLDGFLDAIAPSTRPTLNYLHLQLPHGPFRFYPNGAEYRRRDAGADTFSRYALREESEIPATVDRQRHVLQTQYTDALLGQLLDRLESQDLLDETVLVVASDHGITFNPGVTPRLNSEASLPDDSVDDVFWSALFIKQAGQEQGGVSDAPTELIDVLPTLIDWLDADPGWELDGVAIDSLGDLDQRTLCRPIGDGGSTATVECVDVAADDVLSELLDSGAGHIFSASDSALRVYATGPYGSLVGRAVDELESGDDSRQEVSLRGLGRFSAIGADDLLPGLVSGSLRSGEQGVVLAFSLNGTIAAVTESFPSGDEPAEIAAVLPISLFVAGNNEIETYVVEGSPDAPTLHLAATNAG